MEAKIDKDGTAQDQSHYPINVEYVHLEEANNTLKALSQSNGTTNPQQFVDSLQINLKQLKMQITEQSQKLMRYKKKIKRQSQEKQELAKKLN